MNLRELAEELGLSQTTVSRALNGYPEVSESTRQRVEAAAQRHNYRPNTRAKSLATGRAMAIGHVIPVSSRNEIVNPVFADFIAGAGDVYAQHGYDAMLSVVDDTDLANAYRDIAAKGTVDGVIVHSPRRADPRIPLLREIGLPFVVHGRASGTAGDYCWVDVNNRRAFERGTRFLLELGHRDIALINGLETMDFAFRRRDGYLRAMMSAGHTPDPGLMISREMTEANGHDALVDLMRRATPPTAVLASSMISAFGVARAAADLGLTLGRDLSVIIHDDDLSYFRNGGATPIFTALRSSVRQAGRDAAEMLIDRIGAPEAPPATRLLEADLVVGASTGPAPALAQRANG